MTEMQIAYEAEDANGVVYRMEGVYPIFYTDSKTPRLYLLTEEAESFTLSLFFAGEMHTYAYPLRAKDIIIKSLESCKGLAQFSKLMELKREQAKALN